MHPTLRVLSRLSNKERKRFVRWLESELFHSRKLLTPLAQLIIAQPRQSEESLESAWNQQQKAGTFRPLLSHLGRVLEKFLATEGMLADPLLLQRFVALELERKHFSEAAKKARHNKIKAKSKHPINPQDTLLYDFLSHRDEIDNRTVENNKNWEDATNEIAPLGRSLDRLFIFHKLQQACRIAVYENIYGTETELSFVPAILEEIRRRPEILDHPTLQLFYSAYLTLSGKDPENRRTTVRMLFEQLELLTFPTGKELFASLLNYGISQLNKGEQDFLPISLDLYEIGLKTKLIFRNNLLSGMTYYNVFFLAIKLNRLTWSGDFLEDYKQYLSTHDRESIYPYCKANWHYERNELEKASNLLVHYEGGGSTAFQLQGRITLAKVYYDQGYFDLLESHLNSTSVFISRNKNLGYHGDIYSSFIRLLRKILRRPVHPTRTLNDKLITEINQIKVQSLKDWLLERV